MQAEPKHTQAYPRPNLNKADFAPIHLTMYHPVGDVEARGQLNILIHSPMYRGRPLWPREHYNRGFTNPEDLWAYLMELLVANKQDIRAALGIESEQRRQRTQRKVKISLEDLDLDL